MASRAPRIVLRLLEARLPPRLFDAVAGDLEERWAADAARSRLRAWTNLARTTSSVLWHAGVEARRGRGGAAAVEAPC